MRRYTDWGDVGLSVFGIGCGIVLLAFGAAMVYLLYAVAAWLLGG